MTIGPEPITSTWLRSVRRGISGPLGASVRNAGKYARVGGTTRTLAQCWATSAPPLHQVDELVEQVVRVVRAGRGLRVVLHRERPPVNEFDALDDAVVGAGVADLGGAERGVEPLPRLAFQREPVVLRGDRDPSGGVVDHRDVDAAVAERIL